MKGPETSHLPLARTYLKLWCSESVRRTRWRKISWYFQKTTAIMSWQPPPLCRRVGGHVSYFHLQPLKCPGWSGIKHVTNWIYVLKYTKWMVWHVCQKCISSKWVNPEINNVITEYLYIWWWTYQLTQMCKYKLYRVLRSLGT